MNNLYIKFSLLIFFFCSLSGSLLGQTVIPVNPSTAVGLDGSITVGTAGYNKEGVRLLDSSNNVIGEGNSFPYEFTSLGVGNYTVLFQYKRRGNWYQDEIQISLTYDVLSDYCDSYGDGLLDTGITSVQFNTIDNSSGTSDESGFEDFTSISTRVEIGNPYNLLVNLNTDGGYTVYAVAWIDWNANNSFNDDGERYDLGSVTRQSDGPTSNSPLTIDAPTDAVIGSTRMRLSAKYNGYPSSCEKDFDGEVEDYTLNVVATLEPTITDFTPLNACSGSEVIINGTNLSGATVKFNDAVAVITSNTATQIIVSLPADATTGPISVTTPGGTETSTPLFTVNSLPADAGDISGADIVLPGESKTYVCDPITGATSYEWDLDGVITTTIDPQLDFTFAGDASPGDRILTVKGINACGSGSDSPPLSIYVRYNDPCQTAIVNWDFNEPDLGSDNWQGYRTVNGWQSSLNNIEIWGDKMPNVPSGEQCCELNSIGKNEMWQNVFTVPGDEMRWSINYRYRSNASESIEIRIGKEGSLVNITPISNDNGDGWVSHSGLYTVPDGQVVTQFRIVSVNSSPGSRSSGNLIDDVRFYPIELDKEKPTFNCPTNSDQGCIDATSVVLDNIGVTNLADNCTAVDDLSVEYKIENTAYSNPLVNFGDDPDGNANSEDASGFAFPIGMNTVTYRVTDKSNNSTIKRFTININLNPSPIGIFHD